MIYAIKILESALKSEKETLLKMQSETMIAAIKNNIQILETAIKKLSQ